MKRSNNPFKMVLFVAAMLLVALGSVHGNPSNAERRMMGYSMNSPPGNQIIVTIETPTFDVIQPLEVSILIERGVSVPCKYLSSEGLSLEDPLKFKCYTYYTVSQINFKPDILTGYTSEIDRYPFATDLGTRQRSRI